MDYDIIIAGGSYAGLSAGMALGRALRKVLIIDSGEPCNRFSPHAHNILTHDGTPPLEILAKAREEVLKYDTVELMAEVAEFASKIDNGFEISTASGKRFTGSKLIFATGVQDVMPDIEGFKECWGISILHCPYCHGYEVKAVPTGVMIDNAEMGFEFSKFISNWTPSLTLFTNGKSGLSVEQAELLRSNNIKVAEGRVKKVEHEAGYIKGVILEDGSIHKLDALYAKPDFEQRTRMPEKLGCRFTEAGFIETDSFQRTSVAGVYAAGDNTTMFRSVTNAIAQGNIAGAFSNKDMIEERFR